MPVLPFAADVPLVGQPCAIKAWFSTVLVQCNCGAHEPVLLIGMHASPCPACGTTFLVTEVAFNRASGPGAQIRIANMPPPLPEAMQ